MNRKNKILLPLVFEAVAYGLSGTIYIIAVFLIQDSLRTYFREPGIINANGETISIAACSFGSWQPAGLWILLGFSFSVVIGRLVINRWIKNDAFYWLTLQAFASVLSILLQQIFLFFYGHKTISGAVSLIWQGFDWMISLFLMLIPFTIAFALTAESVKNYRFRNSLK